MQNLPRVPIANHNSNPLQPAIKMQAAQTALPEMPDVRAQHKRAKIFKRPEDLMACIDECAAYITQLEQLPLTEEVRVEIKRVQHVLYDYEVLWERADHYAYERAKRARV